MIATRFKEGHEGDWSRLIEQLRASEQRFGTCALDGDAGPAGSDQGAHVRRLRQRRSGACAGNDPRRQEGLQAARATMAEIFDGAPEFVDLTVVDEFTP